jgi:2-hydroxychromene-2-carboxylate isomerase
MPLTFRLFTENKMTQSTSQPLEFWFDFGSNYSYLAMMRIEALAGRHGVPLILKPFALGPIFKSFGWDSSPFVLQKLKGEYTWRDMERQCAKYGLPWNRPSSFPRRALLPLRVALQGAGQPWVWEFCRQVMHMNFVADREIDDPLLVADILTSLALPAAQLIARAQSDDAKAALRLQSDAAARRGISGAPAFFIGDEMFWGNDRLDDAIAFAVHNTTL